LLSIPRYPIVIDGDECYHVSTVGRDEEAIRRYIKKHEEVDKRLDQQMNLFD